MHPNEARTDTGLVRRLVADQFPGWHDLPVTEVESAGTDNALYRLGDELVVRMPKIDWAVPELDTRARWLPILTPRLSHPVAAPIAVGEPGRGYPWRWSVYRWLDGANPVVGQLDRPDQLAADVVDFISSLRSLDPTLGPPAGFRRGGHLDDRDLPTRHAIADLGDEIDQEAVTAAWEASLDAGSSSAPQVWLHADLSPGNLLVQAGRLSAVLDFTPGVGLPDCELIVAWNLLPPSGRSVLRDGLEVEESAWRRGRGWALTIALLQLDYYRSSNPMLAANARHVIREVVADL